METATLVRSMATYSLPQYIIADYLYDFPIGDSTSIIEMELPALYSAEESYRESLSTKLTGKSYIIDLCSISISCSSENFNFVILNKNITSSSGTIYEVLSYAENDKSTSDVLNRFIIRNEDIPMDNKLYIKITNHDLSNEVGVVQIQLTYSTLQDRLI